MAAPQEISVAAAGISSIRTGEFYFLGWGDVFTLLSADVSKSLMY